MKPIRLRVPREDAAELADDLTAWAAGTGIDPAPTVDDAVDSTVGTDAPAVYKVYVSESFFAQFPKWLPCVEH
ncbi:hypothetical protein LFL96_05010 [Paraburkholderia sp. D15]|uniref:hypothetical protein n=1 Tax=Paraburkholderia sp. D15 TaxID=2880218 RepID=UPI002478F97E|nr:hypothetical protein [Paraburkholderia sp. D15]WGS50866.1 hypothetical protein LFL96_05010 [Paraburkholderia sp. D15]